MVPTLSPVECGLLIRFFESLGFEKKRQKGSHLSMVRPGTSRPVVIPMHREVSVAVILSNLRTAGVSRDVLLE